MFSTPKNPRRAAATPRNPQRTRERLLQAAFQEVYRSGFRGTDLETILSAAHVTKGALYHHFESKEALGYALVDEIIMGITRTKWLQPLQDAEDPIGALAGVIASRSTEREELRFGCPLNNLAQEMSPLDEGLRTRTARVFREWHDGIAVALRRGQKNRAVRGDVDPEDTATFVIATFEGCMSLAKNSRDARVLRSIKRGLVRYLNSLRAGSRRSRANAGG